MTLKDDIQAKTQAVLTKEKITPKPEVLTDFVNSVEKNVSVIFVKTKKNPADYNLTVVHDKNSKHVIPVLLQFALKRK